jgi:ATP-dependent Lhr-like helicase
LQWAHPLVQEWFVRKFGTPTEPQIAGWPHILANRTTLIAAPTGSGKTLAAFLACIDQLIRKALAGELRDCTEVVYISPLKALGNDIQKNLEVPLGEIMQMAGERGILLPQIRTAVRTGDTLTSERAKMLRTPPHILVTTPESLYILLTAGKSRLNLTHVKTVIVDEIHAMADDKRGAHLTLSLERLDALTQTPPTRIGLSATQKPIEQIAHFLTGSNRPDPAIVDVGHRRKMDMAIEVPATELGPIATNEMWGEIYQRIAELVQQHRSTIVFVNTRRLSERLAMHLGEILGEENVASHHGSLSRKLRFAAETKLKNGEIKVLVATASLELGIDVGFVDLVIQISSPRSIAGALQRIGRAGHWRGAIPKGRIFATTRDELIECAAGVRAILQGDLDKIIIPDAPLDILAQQIVAACAAEEWDEDEMFALVKRAYPYRNLERKQYEEILTMLSEGIASKRGRYGAYIHRDQVNRKLRARRGARLAAITSGGAIPETALFNVVLQPEGVIVGTLDEDFAVESNAGDIMLLGNTSWRIRRVESNSGRVLVEDAHGAPPTVPFWRGEAPARTAELSQHVSELRRIVSEMTPTTKPVHRDSENAEGEAAKPIRGITPTPEVVETIEWLQRECGVDQSGAEQIIDHIVTGRAVLGAVPTQQTIIAERFFDEGGGMQLIIHAPFGGRINKAWGLALRKRFCRSFNFELQAAATDDGLNICLAEQHSFPLTDVFHFLQPETLTEILEQAALASPIFKTRWRWDANRSLALLRFMGGKKVPPQIQRIRSDDLLASVFPDVAACGENIEGDIKVPDHPLITEVMKDVLHEAMDLDGLMQLITDLRDGKIKTLAVDTPVPSVFSHEILNANPYAYLDDAPLEERRARAVSMRRVLPESVLEEVGKLDRAAINQVRDEARPDVRDADELHDLLHTLVVMPEFIELAGWKEHELWNRLFEQLQNHRRAVVAHIDNNRYWVAAERVQPFRAIFPQATFEAEPSTIDTAALSADDALLTAVTGWMMHTGPVTAASLGSALGVSAHEIDKALLRMEAAGSILRGNFTDETTDTEWCDRRLLARIHRLTITTLRKAIEPISAAQFMRWLLRWQHVAEGTHTNGERGLLEVLQQLQGFEIPANAWERDVLARRMMKYDPAWLDNLSLTGAVGWGRLSPHPATLDDSAQGTRRIVPTSVAPITFFVRDDADWMLPRHNDEQRERVLSPVGKQVFEFLSKRGASFFADIVRSIDRLKAEVETGLWELVAAGLVTADGFDNLRALIDPRRRSGQGSQRSARPRHSAGRWSLLYPVEAANHDKAAEAVCRMLLRRYGVVFRDVLARESNLPRWRDLQIAFRRLEDRGEIRGGRFIAGFVGEQFALPHAVESLRAMRNLPAHGETVTVSAADPLNLVGILVPGERVPAIGGRIVTYRDGVPVTDVERSPGALAAI